MDLSKLDRLEYLRIEDHWLICGEDIGISVAAPATDDFLSNRLVKMLPRSLRELVIDCGEGGESEDLDVALAKLIKGLFQLRTRAIPQLRLLQINNLHHKNQAQRFKAGLDAAVAAGERQQQVGRARSSVDRCQRLKNNC